jgi:hypothetical protein
MEELYNLALADNGKGVLYTQASPIHGKGLFTNEPLPMLTILCRRLGLRSELSLRDKRAIIGIDGLDPAEPVDLVFKSLNHSCRPNAFLTDTGCLVNFEIIPAATEVTVDYNQLLVGSNWTSVCTCGANDCRHFIGNANQDQ